MGRYKINQRLKVKIDPNHTVLTEEDFVAIIRYLIDLHDGRGFTDSPRICIHGNYVFELAFLEK